MFKSILLENSQASLAMIDNAFRLIWLNSPTRIISLLLKLKRKVTLLQKVS